MNFWQARTDIAADFKQTAKSDETKILEELVQNL